MGKGFPSNGGESLKKQEKKEKGRAGGGEENSRLEVVGSSFKSQKDLQNHFCHHRSYHRPVALSENVPVVLLHRKGDRREVWEVR